MPVSRYLRSSPTTVNRYAGGFALVRTNLQRQTPGARRCVAWIAAAPASRRSVRGSCSGWVAPSRWPISSAVAAHGRSTKPAQPTRGSQITEAFPWDEVPTDLIRDRDARYGHAVRRRLVAMGIRDHPIAPRSPWQNGHAERLIGSIRRECLDHVVILGKSHLCRVLKAYAAYYNHVRPHLALAKDAPLLRPVQRFGDITAKPILSGLHHQY